MTTYRVIDDLEAGCPQEWRQNGVETRVGLPSTLRIQGGSGHVMLSTAWYDWCKSIQTPEGYRYMFTTSGDLDDAIGWHNTGKRNRVEQLTFSGNIVDVTAIVGNRAYIRCFYNNHKPPANLIQCLPRARHPLVHILSTQYYNKLDFGTGGKYPQTFVIANDESEQLWIDVRNLREVKEADMKYQYVLDVWEGSGDIDELLIVKEEVAGIILRINSMAGGHHDDTNFKAQWEQASVFDVRCPYFVYNPWVGGRANWDWLRTRIPADAPKRLMMDIEVRYPNYSTSTYSSEVLTFMQLAEAAGYWPAIYTGYGFLDMLKTWPISYDYWWARYYYSAMPSSSPHTWADMKAKMEALQFDTADLFGVKHVCPGKVKLWQTSGDKWNLPGCAGHLMDINIWPGTREELKQWFGMTETLPEPPEPPVGVDRAPQLIADIEEVLATYKES